MAVCRGGAWGQSRQAVAETQAKLHLFPQPFQNLFRDSHTPVLTSGSFWSLSLFWLWEQQVICFQSDLCTLTFTWKYSLLSLRSAPLQWTSKLFALTSLFISTKFPRGTIKKMIPASLKRHRPNSSTVMQTTETSALSWKDQWFKNGVRKVCLGVCVWVRACLCVSPQPAHCKSVESRPTRSLVVTAALMWLTWCLQLLMHVCIISCQIWPTISSSACVNHILRVRPLYSYAIACSVMLYLARF